MIQLPTHVFGIQLTALSLTILEYRRDGKMRQVPLLLRILVGWDVWARRAEKRTRRLTMRCWSSCRLGARIGLHRGAPLVSRTGWLMGMSHVLADIAAQFSV